jgi:CBS domain containing-hemolysin-like protein
MVIGEMVPKNIALAAPERTLLALAPAMSGFVWLFRPAIGALNAMGNAGASLVGVQPTDELSSAANAAEFEVMLGESRAGGLLEHEEHELLVGALAFHDRSAADVMVPLADLSSAGLRSTVASVEDLIRSSGHSRIVITGSDPHDLVGFVHAKDLLRLDDERRDEVVPLTLCRPTFSVPHTRPLGDVLLEMRRSRRHVAWVHDDAGAALGMVTMEDILEQIVGDITDETDRVRR